MRTEPAPTLTAFSVLAFLFLHASLARATPKAGDLVVERRHFRGGGSLVVSTKPSPTTTACVGPSSDGATAAEERLVDERGGVIAVEGEPALRVWCVTAPSWETAFVVWLSGRVFRRQATGASAPADESPRALGLARLSKIANEGATAPSRSSDETRVVTLVGATSTAEAAELAARFVAPVEELSENRPSEWTLHQSGERLSVVGSELTAPAVAYGWAVPEPGTDDRAVLALTLELLAGGPDARLPRLTYPRGLARHVDAFALPGISGTIAGFWVELTTRPSLDRVRRFVDGTLKQLRLVGPGSSEFARARAHLELAALATREDPVRLARTLTELELTTGDARQFAEDTAALTRVTRDGLRQAAYRTFVDRRRTTVEMFPPLWPEDDPRVARHQLYTVLAGDTLTAVATRFHVSVLSICRANDLDPKYGISPGQPLWIPPNDGDAHAK